MMVVVHLSIDVQVFLLHVSSLANVHRCRFVSQVLHIVLVHVHETYLILLKLAGLFFVVLLLFILV